MTDNSDLTKTCQGEMESGIDCKKRSFAPVSKSRDR